VSASGAVATRSSVRRLLIALAILSLAAAPCDYVVKRHERHTSRAQKREAYRRAGISWDHRSCCVVDHIVPLELGGRDAVSNMQIQSKSAGHQKDLVENFLARCVCRGATPLPVAQKLVVNWTSVKRDACPKEA